MATLKKISFITLLLFTTSTHLVMPFWDNPRTDTKPSLQEIKKNPLDVDAMKKDLNTQRTAALEVYADIKSRMSEKTKFIVGAGTLGIAGVWFLGKITKSALAMAFYAGGLFVVGAIGNSLLQDVDSKKILPEIWKDLEHLSNTAMATFNETKTQATEVGTNLKDIIDQQNKTK